MYTLQNKEGLVYGRYSEWVDIKEKKTYWFSSWLEVSQYKSKNIPDSVPCQVVTSHQLLNQLIDKISNN